MKAKTIKYYIIIAERIEEQTLKNGKVKRTIKRRALDGAYYMNQAAAEQVCQALEQTSKKGEKFFFTTTNVSFYE